MFLSVHAPFNAHLVYADDDGIVTGVHEMATADIRMNGGFFVFKRDVIDAIEPGEELVDEPFARLIARRELLAYPLRRILRADGHDQGSPAPRVAARLRRRALAALCRRGVEAQMLGLVAG